MEEIQETNEIYLDNSATTKPCPEAVAAAAYRRTALVAFICCVIGACLFFLFKEKEILAKIEKLKGEEK